VNEQPPADRSPAVLQTHVSTLLFLGDRVYKLKRPVDLGFVDFRTRSARSTACRAEVRLNRRLAPDVYLGLAEVRGPDRRLGEHLVVMRRMPDARRLSGLVGSQVDLSDAMADLGRRLAAFHADARRSRRITTWGGWSAVRRLWTNGLSELRRAAKNILDAESFDPGFHRTEELALHYLAGRRELFTARQRAGRVVDGHGDLLADDIYLLRDGPRILDCLEFDARLRAGDVIADVASLAMDLESLGAPEAAITLLDSYLADAGDRPPRSLVDHYIAYRAHVRCKVSCLQAAQGHPGAGPKAEALARLSLRHLDAGRVRLVLIGGLPGTGKTTIAEQLAGASGWDAFHSDAVRKQLAGLPPEAPARSAFRAGIYQPAMTDRTYDRMLTLAAGRLRLGQSVVLDASWSWQEHRRRARAVAEREAADIVELRCVVPDHLADERLAVRQASGTSISDADAEVRALIAAAADAWPTAAVVDTSGTPAGSAELCLRAAGWP
jgi:aminoglycoside phosphotransferase family enzyme/predicted kinase